MFESLISGLTSLGAGQEAGAEALKSGDIARHGHIMISPVALNIGEVLRPYNESSPETGGYGVQLPSRVIQSGVGGMVIQPEFAGEQEARTLNWTLAALLIAGGYLGYRLLIK